MSEDLTQPQPRGGITPEQKEAFLEPEEKEMSFLQHLEALRWHLVRGVAAVLFFTIAAFIGKSIVVDTILLGPTNNDFYTYKVLCQLGDKLNSSELCIDDLPETSTILQNRKVAGQFTLHIGISVIAGLIVAFPYFFWEIWRFVSPALQGKERNRVRGTVFIVSFLFFLGVFFGYYIIAPLSYNFFIHYSLSDQITNEWDLSSYIAMVSNLVLVCGFMFQLPVVVYYLSKMGMVSPRLMKSKRRIAYVIILFLGAIFTPADVMSQLLVAIPLFILYELSIFVSKGTYKEV